MRCQYRQGPGTQKGVAYRLSIRHKKTRKNTSKNMPKVASTFPRLSLLSVFSCAADALWTSPKRLMFYAAEHWVNAPIDRERLKDVRKLPARSQEDSVRRSLAESWTFGVDASRRPDGVVRAGHEVRSGRCDRREHRDASDGAAQAMEAARRELEIENRELAMNH